MREASGLALLLRLTRSRRWLFAKGMDVFGFGLEVVALSKGSLVLFQTIVTGGVVVAVVAESRRSGRRLYLAEILGVLAIVSGVSLVGRNEPHGPDVRVSLRGWIISLSVAAAIVVGGLLLVHGRRRFEAGMLAVATGIAFSFGTAFLKNATTVFRTDGIGVVVVASVASYLALAVFGNVVIHRAYQIAPLRLALPVLTAVQPISALFIALLVLQEHLDKTPLGKTWTVLGIVLVVIGSVVASGDFRFGRLRSAELSSPDP